MSTSLQPKSSLLWQILSLCLHVYNPNGPFSDTFSICVNMLTIEDFVSLVDIEFVSTCLHVYSPKASISVQFVSTFLQSRKFPSLADFQFVSTCLHAYKQESFLVCLIFSLCLWPTWLHVYNHEANFSFGLLVYMSTAENLPSLEDFGFATTCLLTCLLSNSSLLWQIFSLYLGIYMSTTKKFPSLADFQFVSTCSQSKILFHW